MPDQIAMAYVDAVSSLAKIRAGALVALKQIPETSPAHAFLSAIKEETEIGMQIDPITEIEGSAHET
ncbi:MAG: hypothetical protein OIF47_00505 [Marinibacterium sp.]|nr:hypothetical protein [Marinibacterium sp.]